MTYEEMIKNLRESVFQPAETPEVARPRGFIPFKSGNLEEAPINRETQNSWLVSVKQRAEELKKQFQKSADKTSGSFTDAFKKAAMPEQLPETPPPPAQQESTFIRRRGDLPSAYAPMPSEASSFLELIDKTEGGGDYDTLFGFSNREGPFAGMRVSEMTLGELREFSKPSGEYGQWVKGRVGRVATPMGRYQFVGTTMREVADRMGLSDDTVFNQQTQDAMFTFYLNDVISRQDTVDGKVKALRGAWEGFKHVPYSTLATLASNYGAT